MVFKIDINFVGVYLFIYFASILLCRGTTQDEVKINCFLSVKAVHSKFFLLLEIHDANCLSLLGCFHCLKIQMVAFVPISGKE